MILLKGVLINESALTSAYEADGRTRVHFTEAEGDFNTNKFLPADIFKAIEAKDNLPQQQDTKIEALCKDLHDTEELYMHANSENEKLRLQIEKLTINIANAPSCEFALVGQDGFCIGNEECQGDCTRCGIYYKFCEPAVDVDETGCQGLKDGTGNYYRKCRTCPGWHRAPAGDPEDN